jgi:hypothetical protein
MFGEVTQNNKHLSVVCDVMERLQSDGEKFLGNVKCSELCFEACGNKTMIRDCAEV